MRINFFEEYPQQVSTEQLLSVSFPSTVFVAASSYDKFLGIAKKYQKINSNLEVAYWPTLPDSYWISAFSEKRELETLSLEIRKSGYKKLKILLDLELPIFRKRLFIKNIGGLFNHLQKIEQIFIAAGDKGVEIYTAEDPLWLNLPNFVPKSLGVSFDPKIVPHKKIFMYYTSMISGIGKELRKKAVISAKQKNESTELGLGVLAKGKLENEPIMSPEQLEKDLEFAKKSGYETVTIFRLGGLNRQYCSILSSYV